MSPITPTGRSPLRRGRFCRCCVVAMISRKTCCWLVLSMLFMPLLEAQDNFLPPINRTVTDAVRSMPSGGRYSTSRTANRAPFLRGCLWRRSLPLGPHSGSGSQLLLRGDAPGVPEDPPRIFRTRGDSLSLRERYPLSARRAKRDGTGIWGRWTPTDRGRPGSSTNSA